MMTPASSNEIMRQTLQKRRVELLEEYEVANNQLGHSLDSTEQIRLRRKIAQIETDIKDVDQKLDQLSDNMDLVEPRGDRETKLQIESVTPSLAFFSNKTQVRRDEQTGLFLTSYFWGSPFDVTLVNITIKLRFDQPVENIRNIFVGHTKIQTGKEIHQLDPDRKGYLFRTDYLIATNQLRMDVTSKREINIVAMELIASHLPLYGPRQFPSLSQSNLSPQKTLSRILVDEYRGQLLFNSRLQRELKGNGFEIIVKTEAYLRDELFAADVLAIWFPRYFEGKRGLFSDADVDQIREYLKQGGSALLIGLGWAWSQYEERPSIDTYPLNHIAEDYGIFFSDAFVFHASGISHDESPITFQRPFMSNHPITQNVARISALKAAPGSLVVSSPAIPLIWGSDQLHDSDGAKNPIILAAADAGQGKLVCMQHAAYINSLNDDNFTLLINILNWLVSRVEGDNK